MPVKSAKEMEDLRNDVRTLDSKLSLLAQKFSTIEKNEEVLGRTLVAHNERLKEIEEKGGGGGGIKSAGGGAASGEMEQLRVQLEALKKEFAELRKETQEMRYILNSINPLEFVTVDQVKELLKQK